MPKDYRKCQNCKVEFKKIRPLQSNCSVICAVEWAKKLKAKKSASEWKVKKKELIEKTKTLSDYKKDLQTLVNKYVRLTKEKECISCKRDLIGVKFDAGHYRNVGSSPALRFELLNIWPQCVQCNRSFHGRLIDYRTNLVNKIGVDQVEWLEQEHDPKKYTIPELKELIVKYRQLIKELPK